MSSLDKCKAEEYLDLVTTTEEMTMTSTYRKGQTVIGLSRFGNTWNSRPVGTVTQNHGGWVRVAWDGTCVEDDMRPEWLAPR